jgi:hypothetical protein
MKTLFSILVVFSLLSKLSAQTSTGITGKIRVENQEGLLKIKAIAINSDDLYHDLNYILISLKKGESGNATNKQSGKFTINPNETKLLSGISINLSKNDGLKLFLFLKDEETDKVVYKDSLEINPNLFTTEVSYIPEQNLELTGLTIDETKTRLGTMFYEFFFKKYNQIPKKHEGTIIISELPTFGRSSQIIVTVDDQVIYSFISKPDEEFIDLEADRTLTYLEQYNYQNSLRKKEFKY